MAEAAPGLIVGVGVGVDVGLGVDVGVGVRVDADGVRVGPAVVPLCVASAAEMDIRDGAGVISGPEVGVGSFELGPHSANVSIDATTMIASHFRCIFCLLGRSSQVDVTSGVCLSLA